jgi:hypothetical protein
MKETIQFGIHCLRDCIQQSRRTTRKHELCVAFVVDSGFSLYCMGDASECQCSWCASSRMHIGCASVKTLKKKKKKKKKSSFDFH